MRIQRKKKKARRENSSFNLSSQDTIQENSSFSNLQQQQANLQKKQGKSKSTKSQLQAKAQLNNGFNFADINISAPQNSLTSIQKKGAVDKAGDGAVTPKSISKGLKIQPRQDHNHIQDKQIFQPQNSIARQISENTIQKNQNQTGSSRSRRKNSRLESIQQTQDQNNNDKSIDDRSSKKEEVTSRSQSEIQKTHNTQRSLPPEQQNKGDNSPTTSVNQDQETHLQKQEQNVEATKAPQTSTDMIQCSYGTLNEMGKARVDQQSEEMYAHKAKEFEFGGTQNYGKCLRPCRR